MDRVDKCIGYRTKDESSVYGMKTETNKFSSTTDDAFI